VLAKDKVRYVGESISVAIADDPYAAKDAIDLIDVEFSPLPVITDVEQAIKHDAPIIHEQFGTNIGLSIHREHGDARSAFAVYPRQKWTRSMKLAVEKGSEFYLEHELHKLPKEGKTLRAVVSLSLSEPLLLRSSCGS
jgi:CO/xanthine dehydrogenase Mo-binding subunit